MFCWQMMLDAGVLPQLRFCELMCLPCVCYHAELPGASLLCEWEGRSFLPLLTHADRHTHTLTRSHSRSSLPRLPHLSEPERWGAGLKWLQLTAWGGGGSIFKCSGRVFITRPFLSLQLRSLNLSLSVCVCVRGCVYVCVRECVCVCTW